MIMRTSKPCRSWLPAAALQTGAVEALLADVVRGWSRDWLARRSLALSGRLARTDGGVPSGDEAHWFALGEAIALSAPESARLVLARALLDAADGDTPATDDDRRLVDNLVGTALDDLRGRLSSLGGGEGERWSELSAGERPRLDDRWEVAISLGVGVPLLRLAMSNDALVAVIKGTLPRPEKAGPTSPPAAGLRGHVVEVSARVGHARVSLAELAELGAGDVIVLDSGLTDPVTLAIDARPRAGFECLVERREHGFVLEMLHSLRG